MEKWEIDAMCQWGHCIEWFRHEFRSMEDHVWVCEALTGERENRYLNQTRVIIYDQA